MLKRCKTLASGKWEYRKLKGLAVNPNSLAVNKKQWDKGMTCREEMRQVDYGDGQTLELSVFFFR
jgi:hypothetical protein